MATLKVALITGHLTRRVYQFSRQINSIGHDRRITGKRARSRFVFHLFERRYWILVDVVRTLSKENEGKGWR